MQILPLHQMEKCSTFWTLIMHSCDLLDWKKVISLFSSETREGGLQMDLSCCLLYKKSLTCHDFFFHFVSSDVNNIKDENIWI